MPRFEVGSSDESPVEVDAANWLAALGEGLVRMGLLDSLERLACEVLPNGRVLARDVRTGQGYVVNPLSTAAEGRSPLPPRSRERFVYQDSYLGDLVMDADDEDVLEDALTGSGPAPAPAQDEPNTDLWANPASALSEPTTNTSRMLALLERVRAAPSDLIAWHEALDGAQVLVPSEAGAALERETDGQLRFLHAFGPRSAGVQGAVMPGGVGIAGFSVDRVASLLVTDTKSDARFCSDFDEVTGFATHAVICVPVAFEGQVYGCLELLNPVLPGGFDRAQLEVVEILADALAGRLADQD